MRECRPELAHQRVNAGPHCVTEVFQEEISGSVLFFLMIFFQSQHDEKCKNWQGQLRKENINKLLAALRKQQSVLSHSQEIGNASLKVSYLITNGIALV